MATDPPDDERFREALDARASFEFVPAAGEEQYATAGAVTRRPFRNWLTPVEEHYICHRNPIPAAEADEWTLTLTVDGGESVDLPLPSLVEEHPTVAVVHTMECAGNGRAFFEPAVESVEWSIEAVSTAFWTGTPVETVLEANGIEPEDGQWLTAVGADDSGGDDVFARSIPVEKALEDCVLAYGMNGRALPPEHGYPLRLVVPGWYGVNSVKWVEELRVADGMVSADWEDDRSVAEWQQDAYRIVPAGVEPTHRRSVDTVDGREQMTAPDVSHPYTFDQHVKSLLGHPEDGATVVPAADGTVPVTGVAWAGDDAVDRVEVSTDGGDTWAAARLVGPDYSNAWRLFRYRWSPEPGTYELLSRATDEHGRKQPATVSDPDRGLTEITDEEYPWNQGGYGNNAYRPLGVTVTVAGEA